MRLCGVQRAFGLGPAVGLRCFCYWCSMLSSWLIINVDVDAGMDLGVVADEYCISDGICHRWWWKY